MAAVTAWGEDIIQLLINNRADVNKKSINGIAAIEKAIYFNYDSAIGALLQHDALVSKSSPYYDLSTEEEEALAGKDYQRFIEIREELHYKSRDGFKMDHSVLGMINSG